MKTQPSTQSKNTKKSGFYEFVIYPKKRGHFIGVCLQLDIIDEGRDPSEVMEHLKQLAIGHIQLVINENLGEELLNRPAPKKYWDILQKIKTEARDVVEGQRLWRSSAFAGYALDALVNSHAKRP